MTELISLDPSGAHVVSEEILAKVKKKNLSPSLVSGLEKCPASWLADSFVMKEIIEEDPDNAAKRGNLFHKIMEDFFAVPPEERSVSLMKTLVKINLESDDYKMIGRKPEVIQWVRAAINGYYNMGGQPNTVNIADLKLEGKEKKGLEVFVKGHVGETSRPILGFIDQVIEDPLRDDDSVIVQDWKSGAKAKKWNPKTKGSEGYAEQRQQIIYSELLRAEGVKVSGARLIFPMPQEVVNVDLGDEDLRKKVIEDVEEIDKKLTHLMDDNTYEFKPSFLCHWCPLVKICPAAERVSSYEKPRLAYQSQPDPEVLIKGIEIL